MNVLRRLTTALAALFTRPPRPLPAKEHRRVMSAARADDLPAIPFPSAIAPRLSFHAAADPGQRVREKRTLLAVFAHPDDESFGPGGTLARYAAEGVDVHLICATDGEAGVMDEEFVAGDCDPAERRVAELRCAVKQLGLSGLHLLGYRDSGMAGSPDNEHPDCLAQADVHDVAGQITGYIRELCPQVIITFDPMGGYLHPDHIATHRATVTAFRAASDRTAYPEQLAQGLTTYAPQKLYYTGLPRRVLRWLVRLMPLLGRDPTSFGQNGDINLVEIAAIDYPFTTRINVTDHLATKDAAAACHRSQGGSDRRLFGWLPRWLVRRIMSTEGFTRAYPEVKPGEPIERDLFAGVA
jgi:LmbE family N-acetylglucosaminyl deacetylase